jgi:hypothetical protein
MKTRIFAAVLLVSFASMSQFANAAGCLKGAAVGGVGGHFAGHHGLLGAAAGCAIGRHQANKHARENAARVNEPVPTRTAHSTTTSTYAPVR